jgi:low affinity Fe/Cu permease
MSANKNAPEASSRTASNGHPKSPPHELFRKFAHKAAELVGSPWAFTVAVVVIIGWAACGPIFKFSDTWQLIINTATTVVTFLMVFLIQNTQNRDAKAIHLKLDELIKAVEGARTELVDLEEMSDQELRELEEEFRRLHKQRGLPNGGAPGSA